ncbi:MAG: hypothetical protein KGL11_14495 [Alphaproteobacteria bacterium]|nr:hypothetical protein [Alphaproteobacteria bacterium]
MAARIVVHSLDDARAALAAATTLGREVTLASAAGAGTFAGPGWFKALTDEAAREFPAARCDTVLDCGGAAGIALAALRLGLKRVRFAGSAEAARRLQAIAAQLDAVVEEAQEMPALDLRGAREPEALCRAWLAGGAVTRA